MPAITRETLIETLESIALLLELKGENPFKTRAYTNAARVIEVFSGDFLALAREGQLETVEGIGKAIAAKLTELVNTGTLPYFEKLRAEFPPTIFELFHIPGLGPKKIKAVWEQLGISELTALEEAARDGRIAGLPGFGAKTAANLLASIEQRRKHSGYFLLGDAAPVAERILEDLKTLPEVSQVSVAGSYRRRKEILHDLDLIVAGKNPKEIIFYFTNHTEVETVLANGETKASVRLKSGMQCDLRVVTNDEYPFALNYFTGSKEHNVIMRSRALERGYTLNEYRLGPVEARATGRNSPADPAENIPKIYQERDLYRALGLDYVEPELREGRGEIAAAEEGRLPKLLELENLRGTFHNHTTASDGRSTLEEMAAAAIDIGLEYLGIADHSKSSFQAHGLNETQLLAQLEEIRRLNATYDGHFRLLAGTECDILKDGVLDFSDEILSQMDYVVASIHSSFTQSEAEMTKRIIRAMENPYVTMVGHLTGRVLLERESYAVNIPAVIDAAAETGTIIELNASPYRLDMDWRWWQLAKEKGVKCAINPDAHHTSSLQHLWFGVALARKGWLERSDVVNCLPLAKIDAALQKKRTAAR
ncbi:MAG TPA: DNA polymerase/3'-5' exonuclease PolX [Chthoniobacterales bacterium]|jgi:DNA polymerase (family 10)